MSVLALDNYLSPFEPEGLELTVTAASTVEVPQKRLCPDLRSGPPQTTATVELASPGSTERIELSVITGNLITTAAIQRPPGQP